MARGKVTREELVAKFNSFLEKAYKKELTKASNKGRSLVISFSKLDKFDPDLSDMLLKKPEEFLEIGYSALDQIELPNPVKLKLNELNLTNIRDLRSRHIGKFICVEGTVRRASEIRPEITETLWECPDCSEITKQPKTVNVIFKPFQCIKCGNKNGLKQIGKKMIDTRWATVEEPFELTEGDKPSQLNILLTDDLVSPEGRRTSDPGNRIRITGILREIPKGKHYSTKLDFYLDTNYFELTEVGWRHLEITKEDEKRVKELANDPMIYEKLIASLAPSLYGMKEIKEAVILQIFGGVPRNLKDGTKYRGNIHILIIGDPSSGKSQLIKLVPEIIPRGKYVSGKGVSVDYDDPVIFMEHGQIKTDLIGKIIDKYYKKDDHGVFVPVKNIQVPAFDPTTYKMSWRPASSVYRHTHKEPLHMLSLKTGRELRVTAGHSVYVLENGKITTKPAKEIKEGDYVVLPSSIPGAHEKVTEINLIEEMSKLSEIDKKNILVISKKSKKGVHINSFKAYESADRHKLKCRFSDHTVPGKMNVDKKLMWLLGLYIADGSLTEDSSLSIKIKFDVASKDKKIINKIKTISKELFNVEPRIYKRKDSNCFNVYIYDKIVYLLFKEILKVGTRANTKDVPDIVFNVSPKAQIEFIKGWFEGDYGVTISKRLMSDIMYLYYMNDAIATFSRRRINRTVKFPDGHTSDINREVYELKAPVPFKKFKNKHSYPPLSQFNLDFTEILKKTQYARASPSSKNIMFSKFRNLVFGRLALIKQSSTSRELMKSFGMNNIRSCRAYLRILHKKGLVEIKSTAENRNVYSSTRNGKGILEKYKDFMKILESDFGFVQVIKNEKVKSSGKYVYDFSVNGCENFVAGFGGIVCHNTGAGLCMSYDTLVPTAHGQIRKIGDIVEEALKKEKKKIKEGWLSEKGDVEIICLDPKDLKLKKKRASNFFKLKPRGKITKIKTSSGREIKVTKENPLLIVRNGELEWEKADDIRNGDHIALARNIPLNHLPVDMEPEFARFAGMIAGDGDVGKREIRFHNTNEKYLTDFSDLSVNLGFKPRKYYQEERIPCVRVASKSLCDHLDAIGIPRGVKCDKLVIPDDVMKSDELLSEFLSGLFNCDGGPVEKGNGSYIEYTTTSEMLSRQVQTSLLRFGILSKMREREPSKKGFVGKRKKYVIVIRGQYNLKKFSEKIGFKHEKGRKLKEIIEKRLKPNTNVDIIPNIGEKLKETRKSLGITIKNEEFLYMLGAYESGKRKFSREQLLRFVKELDKKAKHDYFDFLEKLAKSDIFWDRVVEKNDAKEEWVYDLTVDGEHNFIANDIIVHNTATVTKDEQFMGGWVLEAGALVLTNGGLLSIDEFEKMSQDDQVAMHEALEQGSISIAKASIVATLPAQTSVLAGGNPKFSRFDPYMPISKQITIPDTLLSRFDLKFALRDVPHLDMDKKIVDHVLRVREGEHESSQPVIEPAFIRKYIAYTKKNCSPTLTEEAGKIMRKFYINTRKRAQGGGAIPITLRQFEALIRLSEASARIQLSDTVRKEDVQRAIRLMRFSLQQLGLDTETGEIDIDRAEGALVTSSDRSKIRTILEIIKELSEKTKEIPITELYKLAKKEGIEEVDDIIEKLKREGLLFEPNPGYVQKV